MKENLFTRIFGDGNNGCCRYNPKNCGHANQLPPCVVPPSKTTYQPNFMNEWDALKVWAEYDAKKEISADKGCEPMRQLCVFWYALYMKKWRDLNPAPPTNEKYIRLLTERVAALEAALAEKGGAL